MNEIGKITVRKNICLTKVGKYPNLKNKKHALEFNSKRLKIKL